MEQVFGFVHVPDLYQCPSPCFRKLVSAILRSLYSHLSKKRTWFICREGRYSVNDKNLTLYFIYITTLPSVKEPFSPKQHSKFRSLAGLQNLWFNRTFMVAVLLFSSQVLLHTLLSLFSQPIPWGLLTAAGRPQTLLPNRLTVAIRSKRRSQSKQVQTEI